MSVVKLNFKEEERKVNLKCTHLGPVQNCTDLFLTILPAHTEQGKMWHDWDERCCSLQEKEE